ncbi:hypothetical protein ACQW5G_01360 [Fructilactobacillus sp. Tb1]|uniref:hypothetical protein n=1 Tax=Fructilactobacillus sp. Tb1 TaxID=3422304 RepID=UPI003D27C3E5
MFNFLGKLTMMTIKVSAAIIMATVAAIIGAATFLGYKFISNKNNNVQTINTDGRKEVIGEEIDKDKK